MDFIKAMNEGYSTALVLICMNALIVFTMLCKTILNVYRQKAVGPRAAFVMPYNLPFGMSTSPSTGAAHTSD
jgi:hypothetical protein